MSALLSNVFGGLLFACFTPALLLTHSPNFNYVGLVLTICQREFHNSVLQDDLGIDGFASGI